MFSFGFCRCGHRRPTAIIASAAQPAISATPPNGVAQPSQRGAPASQAEQAEAEQHDTPGKAPTGDPHGKTARPDRDDCKQCRGMDHAIERAGAQQLGGFRIVG